jgi:hypothetical protein
MVGIVLKTCSYCGRENADDVTHCRECGSAEFAGKKIEAEPDVPTAAVLRDEEGMRGEANGAGSIQFEALKENELNNTWVTLVRCGNLVEADLVATRLQAAEIPVFIPDEFLMQAIAFNVNTYGFVRVQVPPSHYEAARAVLTEGFVP